MKRRIGMVDPDKGFVNRFKEALLEQFPEEFELLLFPSVEKALVASERIHLQFLLVDEELTLPFEGVPKDCKIIFLCRREETACWSETRKAVCKYKSISEWRTLLLTLCSGSENVAEGGASLPTSGQGQVCLFTSGGGGVGTSTAAAAFGLHLAAEQKKVAYLNFETFSSTEAFFHVNSNYGLDDVMYALRSNKYEAKALLKRALARDASGVQVLLPCRVPLDAFSFTGEEIVKILHLVLETNHYDYVILDMNADSMERLVLPMIVANCIVLVSNGEPLANTKLMQLVETIPLVCNEEKGTMLKKIYLLYNRFNPTTGQLYSRRDIGRLGGINVVQYRDIRELLRAMQTLPPFSRLEEAMS